ncbi:mechanosensitive ion channel family protein [Dethiosulfatarculus sandiegensis]|uniref:Small mechanosensitive ion channel protein MscS n=1 Tax=Dethiosulfatarculus sandiegensis TaxID=1429043 RepID=A0A0D2J6A9_9BACT|nr:mechanosensitive ion channel domain-containing protein [Dethiosulfatarculus sandiegensis]KIX11236.1 hypothetical protein X474_25705 [Dethiosulfatarculus sandiegensis]
MSQLMQDLSAQLNNVNAVGQTYGAMVIKALLALVLMLLLAKWLGQLLSSFLVKLGLPERRAVFVVSGLHVLVLLFMGMMVLHLLGIDTQLMFRAVLVVLLFLVAVYIVLKPYIPQLPFVTGNTIMTGDNLGKVQSITFLHTRLKTFDGKTIIVPNHRILNEQVINYTTNPNRRVDLSLYIDYDQDTEKVRQVVSEILKSDERVLEKPVVRVVVSKLEPDYIKMQARFWVPRLKVLRSRWDFNEAIVKAFKAEGIKMASARLEIREKTGQQN